LGLVKVSLTKNIKITVNIHNSRCIYMKVFGPVRAVDSGVDHLFAPCEGCLCRDRGSRVTHKPSKMILFVTLAPHWSEHGRIQDLCRQRQDQDFDEVRSAAMTSAVHGNASQLAAGNGWAKRKCILPLTIILVNNDT
jgi:hypothetical protein